MVYYICTHLVAERRKHMLEVILNEDGNFDICRDDEVVATLPYERYDEKLFRAVNSLMESAELERQIMAIKVLLGETRKKENTL